MNLISIPAFQDNYIWVLSENNGRCIIVDPGEAAPVLAAIEENQWQPEAILLTHHHQDHVGGVKQLREKFPSIVVYGPAETQDKGVTQVVHALSYPLGGTWHLPHGVANAILLAPCMRVVRPHAVAKFAQV
ncbi:MBL fold metallo-hydrolase, partial [Klebsiella pneumoniae]|uniref:MBL fold metallo-hydrolase n=1 Tax=Klebsiella pneumoniae TaxID=573 RepID=UPI0022EB63B9